MILQLAGTFVLIDSLFTSSYRFAVYIFFVSECETEDQVFEFYTVPTLPLEMVHPSILPKQGKRENMKQLLLEGGGEYLEK